MFPSTHVDAQRGLGLVICMFLAGALSGCGGGGGGGGGDAPAASGQAPKYTIGGSITGLTGSGLVLKTVDDSVAPAAAASTFAFPSGVAAGATYTVTVATQPAGQTCTVANGVGTVGAANISNVQVTCSSTTVSLGGQITGLKADGLSLSNGTETLTLTRFRVGFSFSALVPVGSPFEVTVTSQPTGQTCTVTPSTGTVPARALDLLVVQCSDALAVGAEPLPSLSAPQPGSAAERKLPLVGLYSNSLGFMIVSPDLQTMHQGVVGVVGGSVSVTDSVWTYQPGTTSYFLTARAVTGSGTFVQGKSLEGTYQDSLDPTRSPTSFSMDYHVANALAVTQGSLQGTWQYAKANSDDITLAIDADGTMVGTSTGTTFGTCALTGTVKLADPASTLNLFKQTLVATGSACKLATGVTYVGMSALMFTPAGSFVGNGYFRQLVFTGVTEAGATMTLPVTQQH